MLIAGFLLFACNSLPALACLLACLQHDVCMHACFRAAEEQLCHAWCVHLRTCSTIEGVVNMLAGACWHGVCETD